MNGLFTSSSATFSKCGKYRYTLTRTWDKDLPVICWLMLNPSTADAERDDPTIRRCIGFSELWGAGGIVVVNIFALRATNPSELTKGGINPICADDSDPWFSVGDCENRNDAEIIHASDGRRLICAWGTHGAILDRGRAVTKLLSCRKRVECLRITGGGHPAHPLYVPGDTVPIPYTLNKSESLEQAPA